MRYLMLCVCLALVSALKHDKATSQQNNNVLLNSREQQALVPLLIRSNIPSHLVIPSISAANSAGLNHAIPINSNLNIQSYSLESLSDLNVGNGFPSADLANLNVGSGIITIPTQQFGSVADYNNILNVDPSFAVEPETVGIQPIESLNPITNSLSKQQNGNRFSIDEAKLVSKLEFSENKNFKVGTNNPELVNGFNSFDISKNTKIENKLPSKTSYSIVQVPEVASFHKTGPLVPSDIPSVSELIKIFDSKSTNNEPKKTTDAVTETTTTTTKMEKSNKDILALIQARISPGGLESRTTDSTTITLVEGEAETTETELTTDSSLVTESIHKTGPLVSTDIPSVSELIKILDSKSTNILPQKTTDTLSETTTTKVEKSDTDILNLIQARISPGKSGTTDTTTTTLGEGEAETTETELTTDSSLVTESINKTEYKDKLEYSEVISISSKKLDDDVDKLSNKTEDAGHLDSSLLEDIIVESLEEPLRPLNISSDSYSSINSTNEELLNKTAIVQPVLVPQLNADDFSNANDILKETSEFKAIIESSELLVNSSGNSTNTEPAPVEPLSTNDDSIPSSETDLNNTHEYIPIVPYVSEIKLRNDTLSDNNESLSSETTESSGIQSRISSIQIIDNFGNDIVDSQTDSNITELETIENNDVGNVDESLNPNATHSCVLCSYTAYINNLNKTLPKESISESSTETSEPQDLITTTSNNLSRIINVESRFSDNIHTSEAENATEVLNDSNSRTESVTITEISVTGLSETETKSTSESSTIESEGTSLTGDLGEDHLAVYNSSVLHILDAVKQVNL